MKLDEYRRGELYGLLAEFTSIADTRAAAIRLKDAGYHRVRIYAPFAIPGLASMFPTMQSKIRKLLVSPNRPSSWFIIR